MGRKASWQPRSIDYDSDFDYQDDGDDDDDEHLIEFNNLIFNQLLSNIKSVPFDGIINTQLTYDGAKIYKTIQSHCLEWLYTADRLNINGIRIYSFRFPSPCHPDYYKSFIIAYHPCFKLINQFRHGLEGWYHYIGDELSQIIKKYLKIAKVMNQHNSYEPRIFINNKFERLDIEFYLRVNNNHERITITFEPGYPLLFNEQCAN